MEHIHLIAKNHKKKYIYYFILSEIEKNILAQVLQMNKKEPFFYILYYYYLMKRINTSYSYINI